MPFEYKELDKDLKTVKAKSIDQSKMTAECWLVQFNGLEACKRCEQKGKRNCGGKNIVETGKNEKGFAVPL